MWSQWQLSSKHCPVSYYGTQLLWSITLQKCEESIMQCKKSLWIKYWKQKKAPCPLKMMCTIQKLQFQSLSLLLTRKSWLGNLVTKWVHESSLKNFRGINVNLFFSYPHIKTSPIPPFPPCQKHPFPFPKPIVLLGLLTMSSYKYNQISAIFKNTKQQNFYFNLFLSLIPKLVFTLLQFPFIFTDTHVFLSLSICFLGLPSDSVV